MNRGTSAIDMTDFSASQSLQALNASYENWRVIVGANAQASTPDGERRFREILEASIRFTGVSTLDVDRAHRVHAALAKGKELLTTALEWNHAFVGRAGSNSSQIRGLQWRLVIAWSGLEQMITKLANSTGENDIKSLLIQLDLPSYPTLPPPDAGRVAIRRWRERDQGDDESGINGFLQAQSPATKRALRRWLILGEPVQAWSETLVLCKVLRHVSAHGDLSATKIREWGLNTVFDRLVPEMGLVAAAIFDRMVVECRVALGDQIGVPVVRHNRALSLCQPHAEALIRGLKSAEIRGRATTLIGRIYVYATSSRGAPDEEAALLVAYGIRDIPPERLRRGVVLGTVELHACICEEGGYRWHFRNPERWKRPRVPERKPQGIWFAPFPDK